MVSLNKRIIKKAFLLALVVLSLVLITKVFAIDETDDNDPSNWRVECKNSTELAHFSTPEIQAGFRSYFDDPPSGTDECYVKSFTSPKEMWEFEACNLPVVDAYRGTVWPDGDGDCETVQEFSEELGEEAFRKNNQENQEAGVYERDTFYPPVDYTAKGYENNIEIWWGDRIREGHPAWDIIAFPEDTYHAIADGKCIFAGKVTDDSNTNFVEEFGLNGNLVSGGYGNVVVTKHEVFEKDGDSDSDQIFTIYVIGAHLTDDTIPPIILDCHKKEEIVYVEKGDVLGDVGNSGNSSAPHLHFEIRKDKLITEKGSRLPYTFQGEEGECDDNYCDGRCIIMEEECEWGEGAKVIESVHNNQAETVYNQDFTNSQDFYSIPIINLTDSLYRGSTGLGESCNVHSDCANEGIVCDGGRCVNGNNNAFVYFSENFDPVERGIVTKKALNDKCYMAATWQAPDGKSCYRGVTKEFHQYLSHICDQGLIHKCLKQSGFRDGTKLIIKYGYRDAELQSVLKAQSPAGAASAGYSQHQSGNAIDIFFTPDPGQYTDFNYVKFRQCLVNGTNNWIIHPLEWDTPHFYYCGDHGCDTNAPLYASGSQDIDQIDRSKILAIDSFIDSDGESTLNQEFLKKVKASESVSETSIQNVEPGTYAVFQDNEQVTEVDIAVDEENVQVRFFNDKNANNVKDTNEEYIEDTTNIKLEKRADVIEYDLNSGWNLINLPLIVYDDEDQEITMARRLTDYLNNLNILQDIQIVHIAKFENGQFKMYSSRTSELDNGTEFAEDFPLVPGQALFIFNAKDPASIKLKGQKFDSEVPLQLSNGWNMVGIIATKQDQYTAEELLTELKNQQITADSVSQFENGIYQTVIKPASENLLYGNDFNIVSKRGYFIRVKASESDNMFTP